MKEITIKLKIPTKYEEALYHTDDIDSSAIDTMIREEAMQVALKSLDALYKRKIPRTLRMWLDKRYKDDLPEKQEKNELSKECAENNAESISTAEEELPPDEISDGSENSATPSKGKDTAEK